MRKRVLYLSNIQVPYRVRFFNELAEKCDLTVFYSSKGRGCRDQIWMNSEVPAYPIRYGRDMGNLLRHLRKNYDAVIVGCYTDPAQIWMMAVMHILGISYSINLDGEAFLEGKGWKPRCKRWLLSTANQYFVAGERAARSLQPVAREKPVFLYHFSSLFRRELDVHRGTRSQRNHTVLVVGQYFPYKGMDIALKAAAMDPGRKYLFVGMGERTDQFLRENRISPNVQVIPFLQKKELEVLYQTCGLLVLPSRQECWGLVINEAASFGMPIISTWGSGAAVEFLADHYPQYLAKAEDAQALLHCIQTFFDSGEKENFRAFLLEKSRKYDIEENVLAHLRGL